MNELESRTQKFAIEVRLFLRSLNKDFFIREDIHQLLRSSGSVGANYIEANECLSKKDFLYRIKICLKEAKESRYWLKIIRNTSNELPKTKIDQLIDEATQLVRIFASIVKKLRDAKN
jgi:four helix bundle protein